MSKTIYGEWEMYNDRTGESWEMHRTDDCLSFNCNNRFVAEGIWTGIRIKDVEIYNFSGDHAGKHLSFDIYDWAVEQLIKQDQEKVKP